MECATKESVSYDKVWEGTLQQKYGTLHLRADNNVIISK